MISVVIPALNEEPSILQTIEDIQKVFRDAYIETYEIVVVDDGSSDQTAKVAAEAGATVIVHPHNIGYGKSLKDGITAANFDTIVITDADGTYPVQDIPSLLAKYRQGFDMVVGARTGKHYHESIIKFPLRWILRSIVEFTAGRKIPDINSGLRVFSRATIMEYFNHLCDTFSFTTSATLAYMMTGRFVHYCDIEYFERSGQSKVRLFRDSLRTLQYIIEAATYYNPLKIFLLFATICLLFATITVIAAFIWQVLSFFSLAVGAILLAIFMVGMGLLAVLLKQIMIK